MHDFFISYNHEDRSWAEWIAWQLEEAGYTTVLQAWDFLPGVNFVLAMQQATAAAERTIAVLSPNYLTSRFTQSEWAAAFHRDPTSEEGLLVPVLIEECDLNGLFPQIVYIDLVKLDEATAKDMLLAGVRRTRAKPSAPPDFPGAAQLSGLPKPIIRPHFPPAYRISRPTNVSAAGRGDLVSDRSLDSDQASAMPHRSLLGGASLITVPMDASRKARLVDALLACSAMNDRHTRDVVVGELPNAIKQTIQRSPIDRVDVINIVNRCLAYPKGLTHLIASIRLYESDSPDLHNVEAYLQ